MRYNIIKFIEPLATAAANALTPLLRHEMGRRESGARRLLSRAWMGTGCAVQPYSCSANPLRALGVGRTYTVCRASCAQEY